MSECMCCGLGGITGPRCGHCRDADCEIFGSDYCKAAEMEVTWRDD